MTRRDKAGLGEAGHGTARLPDLVQVFVECLHFPDGNETIASVRDVNGNPVTVGSLKHIHNWLRDNGFTWVVASNGKWARKITTQQQREEWR